MAKKRRKHVTIVLLAVLAGVVAYGLLKPKDEPKYQGRYLSDWLEEYEKDVAAGDGDTKPAAAALRSIGTNALPYLIKWMHYESPAWRTSLGEKLPKFISKRESIRRWVEGEAALRAGRSGLGFKILRTNAASAIPALEALMKDAKEIGVSFQAMDALRDIGEPATPALIRGLNTPNVMLQLDIVDGLVNIISRRGESTDWKQFLIKALNDEDVLVRAGATNALRNLVPDFVPAAMPP